MKEPMNFPFRLSVKLRYLVLLLFLSLATYWLAWPWPFPAQRGRLAAHIDIALGHYRYFGVGLPVYRPEDFAQLLKSRYGIEYQQKAFCIVSQSLMSFVDAYNQVSTHAATEHFHRDVIDECRQEARIKYMQLIAPVLAAPQN